MKSFDQIKDEEEILDCFSVLKEEAEEAISERVKKYGRNFLMYMGEHYLRDTGDENQVDDRNPSWRFRVKRDMIGTMVDRLRPILMRGYPKYFVDADFADYPASLPTEGTEVPVPNMTDGDLAQHLQEIIEATHLKRGEGIEVAKLLVDVLVGGTADRKVVFDKNHNRVLLPVLNFEHVLPDPYGGNTDFSDHKYVIIRNDMDAADIERIYNIKESEFGSSEEEVIGKGLIRKVKRYFRGSNNKMESDDRYRRRRYPVYELFYNEATPNSVMEGEKEPNSLKFPRGRQLVIINEKKVVVDRHNPYWHGEFPLVSYVANPIPHQLFGRTEVDTLVPIQEATNILMNMIVTNAMLAGNNQWMYEEGALQAEEVTNQPGLMIPVSPGGLDRVRRIDPAPLSGDTMALLKEMEHHGRSDISGVQDVLMGREPTNRARGVLANTLQAAALTRQGFKVQSLDESYRRQANMEISLIQQFADYQDPQMMKMMDMGEFNLWSESLRYLLYDVKVESQADFPHNVTSRINFAVQLVQMGVFDLEEFMTFTGVKVRPELRARIRQMSNQVPMGAQAEAEANGGLAGLENLGMGVPQQAMPQV